MAREFRARFTKGKIEPLEKVDFEEGEEIRVIIPDRPKGKGTIEALRATAGAWKGTLDFDAYLKDIYASRRQRSRDITL